MTPTLARRRPSTLRGQQTRAVLLEAAEEVFGRRGFSATSIGELTQRAGVGTGTF